MLHNILRQCLTNLCYILATPAFDVSEGDFKAWWRDILAYKHLLPADAEEDAVPESDADELITARYREAVNIPEREKNARYVLGKFPEAYLNAIDVAFRKHVLPHMDAFCRLPKGDPERLLEDTEWVSAMFTYALDVRKIILGDPSSRLGLDLETRDAIKSEPFSNAVRVASRAVVMIMGDLPNGIAPLPLLTMGFVEALAGKTKQISLGAREVSVNAFRCSLSFPC